MRRIATAAALLGACAALLAGCVAPPDHVVGCMFEVDPPGAYEWPAVDAVPTVIPGEGGTAEGAAVLNACIRSRASATGDDRAPTSLPPWFIGVSVARARGDAVTVTQEMGHSPAARLGARAAAAGEASTPTPMPAQVAGVSAARAHRELNPTSCPLEMVGGAGYACRP